MNYYGAKELAESFRTVRKNTLAIARDIPEQEYGFRPAPDTRSVGELLAHVAVVYNFQYQIHAVEKRTTMEGFDFTALRGRMIAEEKQFRSKDEILELLRTEGEKWAGWLQGLSDDFLGEHLHFPPSPNPTAPASKSRFELVLGVKEHEMHHRGQLMLIERLLGIVPHLTREMQARFAAATVAKT